MTARITKTATKPENYFHPAYFYRSAREGMADFLSNVLTPHGRGVLLPAFIGWSPREGSGVFDPVLTTAAQAGFYNLTADLEVDLADLERRLATGAFRVIVVIHYFGRTEPQIDEIRKLADRHSALLVEDLAHGFFSAMGRGQGGRYGHVCLYSLHKMFPFENGGMVTYPDAGLVSGQKSTAPEFATRVLSYDWRAIGEIRRSNFCALTAILAASAERGAKFELLWPELADGDVPQTLPVRILGDGRDSIYAAMNDDGFGMVSLYHTLIDAVAGDFDGLADLSRHIINFPVHQDVSDHQLQPMVDSFVRHLNQ